MSNFVGAWVVVLSPFGMQIWLGRLNASEGITGFCNVRSQNKITHSLDCPWVVLSNTLGVGYENMGQNNLDGSDPTSGQTISL